MREFKDLKIAVAGTGYVGLSIATLLSQHHKVTAVDIVPEKVELINNKKSPMITFQILHWSLFSIQNRLLRAISEAYQNLFWMALMVICLSLPMLGNCAKRLPCWTTMLW